MFGHFRSRDKDGSHTTRSTIFKNPMLNANSMALGIIADRSFTLQEEEFSIFLALVTLHLTWLPLYVNLSHSLEITTCKNELSRPVFRILLSDRQTGRQDWNYTAHCFAGGQNTDVFTVLAMSNWKCQILAILVM